MPPQRSNDLKQPTQAELDVGARLKQERERLQWSADKAAETGRVSRTAQYNYEAAVSAPDANYLRLVREQGLDVLYVIAGLRERAPTLSEQERDLLDRYGALPPKLRKFVDQAALLSDLAFKARPDYPYEPKPADDESYVGVRAGSVKAKNIAARDMNIHMPAKKPKR